MLGHISIDLGSFIWRLVVIFAKRFRFFGYRCPLLTIIDCFFFPIVSYFFCLKKIYKKYTVKMMVS